MRKKQQELALRRGEYTIEGALCQEKNPKKTQKKPKELPIPKNEEP
jgi:hypothetical protein